MTGKRRVLPCLALASLASFACGSRRTPVRSSVPDVPLRVDMPTTAYRCADGFEFIVQRNPVQDNASLYLPGRTIVLPRVEGGPGDRYLDRGEGVEVRIAGEDVSIRIGDEVRPQCPADPGWSQWVEAALNLVSWRGVGTEGDWVVEIVEHEGIVFVTGEGRRREFPGEPDVGAEAGATVFRAGESDQGIVVRFRKSACTVRERDLPLRVEIELGDEVHRGCGADLRRWNGVTPGD